MCTPQTEAILKDSQSFQMWKADADRQLNSIQARTVRNQNTFLELVNLATGINDVYNCSIVKKQNVETVQTDIANLQSRIAVLDKTTKERTEDVEIAKHRTDIKRNPEMTRSYYDGWLPINRPLKHFTVPALIGISLFLLTLTFFYFMSLIGIDARLSVRVPISYGSSGTSQFTTAFWAMSGVSIILLALTIYGFRK